MTSSWRDHQGVTAFDDVIKFILFPKNALKTGYNIRTQLRIHNLMAGNTSRPDEPVSMLYARMEGGGLKAWNAEPSFTVDRKKMGAPSRHDSHAGWELPSPDLRCFYKSFCGNPSFSPAQYCSVHRLRKECR